MPAFKLKDPSCRTDSVNNYDLAAWTTISGIILPTKCESELCSDFTTTSIFRDLLATLVDFVLL